MNVFALDRDPTLAARAHCDRHLLWQITEAAQMLAVAHHRSGTAPPGIYRPSHENHPCSIWARETTSNYRWLHAMGVALGSIYRERFGRTHRSEEVLRLIPDPPPDVPEGPLTPFAQVMPPEYQSDDPVEGYRSYFRGEKAHLASWRDGPPAWWPG
jgi:hypothetical protein